MEGMQAAEKRGAGGLGLAVEEMKGVHRAEGATADGMEEVLPEADGTAVALRVVAK